MATQTTVATHSLRLMFLVAALFSCATANPQGLMDRLLGRKLQVYQCKNVSEAAQCNSSCSKSDGVTTDFLVDIDKSMVMQRVYTNGKASASGALRNCQVFGKSNWSCSDSHQMTDGVYHNVLFGTGLPVEYLCAK